MRFWNPSGAILLSARNPGCSTPGYLPSSLRDEAPGRPTPAFDLDGSRSVSVSLCGSATAVASRNRRLPSRWERTEASGRRTKPS